MAFMTGRTPRARGTGALPTKRQGVRLHLWIQPPLKVTADLAGDRHALRIHLKASDRANQSFPLEPYVQPPDAAFQSNIQPGTLVVPVHPSLVPDRFLHRQLAAQIGVSYL